MGGCCTQAEDTVPQGGPNMPLKVIYKDKRLAYDSLTQGAVIAPRSLNILASNG